MKPAPIISRELSASPPSPADESWIRSLVRIAWVVGLLAVAAQLAEIPWRSALRGYDNTFNYLWLRSLMVDGDWDFANDLEQTNTLTGEAQKRALDLWPTEIGRIPNKYGVGWAILSVPGYLVAELLVRAGSAVGMWTLAPDGFNVVYQICLVLWHVFLALVGLMLTRRVLSTWLPDMWVAAGLVTVWLGSPLIYYQTSNLSMSHNAAFFSIAVSAYGLVRGLRESATRWPWLLAGAGFGLAAVTRYQTLVFGLVAVWAIVERVRQHGWRSLNAVAWIGVGFVPFVILQSFAWRAVYGRWFVFSYGVEQERFHWFNPAWLSSLFSSWHGLYYWHPLLLVASVGLVWWTVVRRGPALAWCGGALATSYVNGAWWCWWFAAAFGNRAFDAALIALMAGQAFLLARVANHVRRILWLVCALLIVWNVYVLVLYRTAAISRSEAVTWGEMLRAAPRLFQHLEFE